MSYFDLEYALRHFSKFSTRHAAEVALAKHLGITPPKAVTAVSEDGEGGYQALYTTASGAFRVKKFKAKEEAEAFAAKKK